MNDRIIDIIFGGDFDALARRLATDNPNARLASGGYVRAPGGSLEDILSAILSPPSLKDRVEAVDEAIAGMIEDGVMAYLKPATQRTTIQINADTIYIGPEGFTDKHPHVNILTRHTRPDKRDRWRLWSICPGYPTVHAFHFKGFENIEDAERVANIILDIGLGLIGDEPYLEALLLAKKRAKPPAAPAAGPVEPAEPAAEKPTEQAAE